MKDLYEIPSLPTEIIEAAENGQLVIFLGAGASRLVGCPSWEGLADAVLRSLAETEEISYSDVDSLKSLDPREKLSIASIIATEKNIQIDYRNLLKEDEARSDIYRHLNNIGCPFVTTNYDLLASPLVPTNSEGDETHIRPKRYYQTNDFLAGKLAAPETVIHLHGNIDDPNKMVVTTKDYLQHYDDEFVKAFLGDLFEHHTILFVGYGLKEAEILEHVLRRGNVEDSPQRKRFLLQGYYSGQGTLYELMEKYYRESFGVHLCGFLMDRKDYSQLENVIADWSPKINFGNRAMTDEAAFIREVAHGVIS